MLTNGFHILPTLSALIGHHTSARIAIDGIPYKSSKMNNILTKLGLVPYFTQQLADSYEALERLARVVAVHRSKTVVVRDNGEQAVELCPALHRSPAVDRPTVGDWVVLDESHARIEQVLERKSLFKRVSPGSNNEIQPIAANIDTVFIVTSCNEEFKESRLERYLALCKEAGAMPVIILTKADLADDADSYIARARKVQAGVPVEQVNTLDPAAFPVLRAWVGKTDTVALVGSSGVGKSTILNRLAETELAATGTIREDDKKGRHTTTHRELHILPAGGLVIDVPGMRELRVADINQAMSDVFQDIEALAGQCRFTDCKHEAEPGCAVQRAIEEVQLEPRRLSNYQKLLRENAQATASIAEKRARDKDFGRIVKEAKAMKHNR